MKKIITGNEAVALGALTAGVKVVSGYPGTPSTGALASLLLMDLPDDTYVEWSVNEKVAFEVAIGVAWAGHRALCTMKMSGINVAYDSLLSGAQSGCEGGLVIYVADDPGTSAGMCEQDSRGFAMMSDMVMLEPNSVAEAYDLTIYAFELSEKIKTPVFVRSVAAIANSFAEVDVDEPGVVSQAEPLLIKDIGRFTKAGAVIGMSQHRTIIENLAKAEKLISEKGLNELQLSEKKGGLGIIASGMASAYLEDGFALAENYGFDRSAVSLLRVVSTSPYPAKDFIAILEHCNEVLVLEELEPHLEKNLYVEAQRLGFTGKIYGKLNGLLSRIGEYGVAQVVLGLKETLGLEIPGDLLCGDQEAEKISAERPITVCAGCPHRGTYLAINQALRKLKLKKDQVMVTGDIGCTILGMNPPFEIIWSEISMGASVSYAQGYMRAGVKTPVIATIGDSTFFHGGMPGLVNAIQHQANLTLIIMDNRWTAMTGMQVNPGTPSKYQAEQSAELDIAKIVPAMGVENFWIMDPFKLDESAAILQEALELPGVKVVLSRQECAIQAMRRGDRKGKTIPVLENCNSCNLCIMLTGCAALNLGPDGIEVDSALCYGCGLCVQVCNRGGLRSEPVEKSNEVIA